MESKDASKDSVPLQYFTLGKQGLETLSSDFKPDDKISRKGATLAQYSRDGKYLAIVSNTGFEIVDSDSSKTISQGEQSNISAVTFSPKGTYLLTFSNKFDPETQDNLRVWEIATGQVIAKMPQKAFQPELWPTIKWFDSESFSARMVTGEIQFFSDKQLKRVEHRLKLADVSRFALSPGNPPLSFTAFVPQKGSQPASARLYKFPSMELVTSKSFFKAQDVEFYFNSTGTAVIVLTKTDVDRTGKSYYGETGLYFFSSDGKISQTVPLKKEGSIHDVAWSPNGANFAVIYGVMPNPTTTVFDVKCAPVADLGTAARNILRWSPHSRLLLTGGFGNLAGHLDIWDVRKLKKLGSATASSSSVIEWSPDSHYVVTAIVAPKMHVENGYKVWRVDGSAVHSAQFEELNQVAWRPGVYSYRPPSPRGSQEAAPVASPEPAKPAKYVHPNARGRTVASIHDEPVEGPMKYKKAQAAPAKSSTPPQPGVMSAAALKNQKRKQARKRQQEQAAAAAAGKQQNEEATVSEEPQTSKQESTKPQKANNAETQESGQGEGNETSKKIKAIQKKLRQIEALKKDQATGKTLDAAQIEKMKAEATLKQQLKSLQEQAQGSK